MTKMFLESFTTGRYLGTIITSVLPSFDYELFSVNVGFLFSKLAIDWIVLYICLGNRWVLSSTKMWHYREVSTD